MALWVCGNSLSLRRNMEWKAWCPAGGEREFIRHYSDLIFIIVLLQKYVNFSPRTSFGVSFLKIPPCGRNDGHRLKAGHVPICHSSETSNLVSQTRDSSFFSEWQKRETRNLVSQTRDSSFLSEWQKRDYPLCPFWWWPGHRLKAGQFASLSFREKRGIS